MRENIGKPKEIWKALKSLVLPSKITLVSQVSLIDGEKISFDEKTNNNSFKNFYANLALNLVNKLPHAPKDDADVLALQIAKLCNLSMKSSKFSLDFKIIKLKSLYKKGSKTDPKKLLTRFTSVTFFKSYRKSYS